MKPLRWTGVTLCAALAVVSLVYAVIALTEDWVGGFGAMDWLSAGDYASARPDPLAAASADILEHMNRDHADAVLTFARVLAREDAEKARMVGVDRLGFRLRLRQGPRFSGCRIPFPREVTSPALCREVLIEMLRECRRRG